MSQYSQKYLKVIFGEEFLQYLSSLNVLLIGVGGIGCELLKALSPYKFKKIEILDLDKIEVSNLNRQFLFRNQHVGKSKAHVAKETVSGMFPHMEIVSHHNNIFEPQYAVNFFKNFQIVFMALDNAEARSYVNKLCMILDIPLLEAGTTGHKGQAMLIKKGMSRCYSCYPKPKAKTYPVCTIRTFPEKPIHCIIWGKHLFDLLFGPQEKDNPLIDMIDSLKMTTEADDTKLAMSVFNELFYNQITKVKEIEPEKFQYLVPLKIEESDLVSGAEFSYKKVLNNVEDIKASIHSFIHAFKHVRERKEKEGPIVFDKDDNLALKFVSAISNIRAHVFNIAAQSEFTIKEMAGNIVPTIASTNAIVAAIQVTEAIKFLQTRFLTGKNKSTSHIKNKELYVQNTRTTKILEASLGKENAECLICNENFLPHLVFTNFGNTLKDFIHNLKEKDSELKEFRITNSKGGEIYETSADIDDDEEEKERNENNASKTLEHWFGTYQGDIVLNNDTNGAVEKYLIANDTSVPLNVYNFTKREQNKSKPAHLSEDMITKMLDDKAKEIAANKVKAYSQAKENEEHAIEEEGVAKGSTHKEPQKVENGALVLEDDDDEDAIMFVEPAGKDKNGTQNADAGKRKPQYTEEGNQAETGPTKKVKTDEA